MQILLFHWGPFLTQSCGRVPLEPEVSGDEDICLTPMSSLSSMCHTYSSHGTGLPHCSSPECKLEDQSLGCMFTAHSRTPQNTPEVISDLHITSTLTSPLPPWSSTRKYPDLRQAKVMPPVTLMPYNVRWDPGRLMRKKRWGHHGCRACTCTSHPTRHVILWSTPPHSHPAK